MGNTVLINQLGTNKYKSNTKPTSPKNLCTYLNGNSLTMSWGPSTDQETPTLGLGYNLYVKQNGVIILSPMSDLLTGFRRVAQRGNVDQNTSWTITLPSSGGQIEWGVQAIDTQFIGSPFLTSLTNFTNPTSIPDLTLCGTYPSNVTYLAPNITTCSSSVLIASSASVTVNANGANGTIRLLPGFVAQSGSKFNARVISGGGTTPCSTFPSGRVATDNPVESIDKAEVSEINVYPNPTTGVLNIEALFGRLKRAVTLQVISITGSVILSRQYDNVAEIRDQIDLGSFSQGIYLISIQDESGFITRRILKL